MSKESENQLIVHDESTKHFTCGLPLSHCIVTREKAYDYITEYKLKVNYLKELKDGTPRRIWELRDPDGDKCGLLFTAHGVRGQTNRDNYGEDIFDFMEIQINRDDFADPNKPNSPTSSFFINQEIEKEKDKKEKENEEEEE